MRLPLTRTSKLERADDVATQLANHLLAETSRRMTAEDDARSLRATIAGRATAQASRNASIVDQCRTILSEHPEPGVTLAAHLLSVRDRLCWILWPPPPEGRFIVASGGVVTREPGPDARVLSLVTDESQAEQVAA